MRNALLYLNHIDLEKKITMNPFQVRWFTVVVSVAVSLSCVVADSTDCASVVAGQNVSVGTALENCPQVITDVTFNTTATAVRFANLVLVNPKFVISVTCRQVEVENMIIRSVGPPSDGILINIPSTVIAVTLRNNTIAAGVASSVLSLSGVVDLATTISVVANRVEFDVTASTNDHYLLACSATLDTAAALVVEDNTIGASGSNVGGINLHLVRFTSQVIFSDVSLRVIGNTVDASGAMCGGDQCSESPFLSINAASPPLEAVILYFSGSLLSLPVTVQGNTIRWSGAHVRRNYHPMVVALRGATNLVSSFVVSGNLIEIDGWYGGQPIYNLPDVVSATDISFLSGSLQLFNNTVLAGNLFNSAALVNSNVLQIGAATVSGDILIEGNLVKVRNCTLRVADISVSQVAGRAILSQGLKLSMRVQITILNNSFAFDTVYFRTDASTLIVYDAVEVLNVAGLVFDLFSSVSVTANAVQCTSIYLGVSVGGGTSQLYNTSMPNTEDTPVSQYHRLIIIRSGLRMSTGSTLVMSNNNISVNATNHFEMTVDPAIVFSRSPVSLDSATLDVSGNVVALVARALRGTLASRIDSVIEYYRIILVYISNIIV